MGAYASRVVDHLTKFPSVASFADTIDGVRVLETDRFADGEMEVVVNSSLRGKDVVLFASCARNGAGVSLDEAKVEL
jgi:ribose-phosphate pyrophosphokinase